MRAYIRHPVDVPIEFSSMSKADPEKTQVQDVSLGGLSFSSTKRLPVGGTVKIRIPIVDPPFEAEAEVIWCLSHPDSYDAGVKFNTEKEAFTARMVEQICHIEHYRLWVEEVEGRNLDGEQAAKEWIDKFAKDFPKLTD